MVHTVIMYEQSDILKNIKYISLCKYLHVIVAPHQCSLLNFHHLLGHETWWTACAHFHPTLIRILGPLGAYSTISYCCSKHDFCH
jgi:hypothetical protein